MASFKYMDSLYHDYLKESFPGIDMDEFVDRFNDNYEYLYSGGDEREDYDALVEEGDNLIGRLGVDEPEFIKELNSHRGDVLSSDREVVAFLLTWNELSARPHRRKRMSEDMWGRPEVKIPRGFKEVGKDTPEIDEGAIVYIRPEYCGEGESPRKYFVCELSGGVLLADTKKQYNNGEGHIYSFGVITHYKNPSVSESLNSKKLNEDRHDDRRVREYLSELLYGIKDSGLQELVRNIIFSYASSMDWDYVVDLIIKYMPECTIELADLGIIDENGNTLSEAYRHSFDDYDGWSDEDIKLHKSTDWASRNYADLPVDGDEFEGDVVLIANRREDNQHAVVTFKKYLRANPMFPPYYAPADKKPFGTTIRYVGPMYNGKTHNGYDVHDRYETQEAYNILSM